MSVDVITFGCRLNAYESEAMKQQAEEAGLGQDVVIINTCAVTAEAVRQAKQTIRKIARERSASRIVVTGCAAQIDPAEFADMEQVSLVLGNHDKMQPENWKRLNTFDTIHPSAFGIDETEKIIVNDIMSVKETAGHLIEGMHGRVRAFVQIQNGCDHRCTFCVIPYGRGNSRSVPMGVIVDQVRRLVEHGTWEIVLSGVDITSYGKDLPGNPTLGTLVQTLLRLVPELPRLRISSIDSIEADQDLLNAFATEERLMPHVHLSLQSGDDMILKRMKRRHLRKDSIGFCKTLRSLRPDIVFGADIIAGFPTETEEMFQNSLDIVDECGLTHLHVFPFSSRPGTPAARMPQLTRKTVKERAKRLREKGERALQSYLAGEVNREIMVLSETEEFGHSEAFASVRFNSPVTPGRIYRVRILKHTSHELLAELA